MIPDILISAMSEEAERDHPPSQGSKMKHILFDEFSNRLKNVDGFQRGWLFSHVKLWLNMGKRVAGHFPLEVLIN